MKFDPSAHHRRSIRLKEYDYSLPGAYFITLITQDKVNLFGEIIEDRVSLNVIGQFIRSAWLRLPRFFPIRHDEWVLMPNHLHGIIWILDPGSHEEMIDQRKGEAFVNIDLESSDSRSPNTSSLQPWAIGTKRGSLGAIIQNFKSISTRKINQLIVDTHKGEAFDNQELTIPRQILSNASPLQVWQRNYFERIVRNEKELDRIRQYIIDNPRKWAEDDEYNG